MKVPRLETLIKKLALTVGGVIATTCAIEAAPIVLKNPTATFSQSGGWDASSLTDGVTNDFAGWAVFDFGRGGAFAETAVVETETDIGFASGSRFTFRLFHVNHNPQHGLGRFRISYTKDSRDTFADGLNTGGDVSATWLVLTPLTAEANNGATLSIQPDGSILAGGGNPEKCVYTVSAETEAQGITGFRIEALEDPSLPSSGPGRYSSNGNFVLTEFMADVVALVRPVRIPLQNPTATFSQVSGWNVSLITDGVTNSSAGWATYDFGRSGAFAETAVVETVSDVGFESGTLFTFALYHVNHNPQHGLGRFRLSYTTDPRETFADGRNSGGDVSANWVVITPSSASSTAGVELSILDDGSIRAGGENPANCVYTVNAELLAKGITGFRIETLEDPTLPAGGPGRYPSNGNFVLTEFTAIMTPLPGTPVNDGRFSLSDDFSASQNPSGVWAYGAKPSIAGDFSTFGIRGLNPFQYWQLVAGQEPTIYRNGTSNTITIAGGQGVFPPGTTFLYSGTDGAANGFGVARFTAPVSTNYLVEAAAAPVYDGSLQGDTDFHVARNGIELFSRNLAPSDRIGYTNVIALSAGDTLDFLVGRGADGSGTASGLKFDIEISTTEVVNTLPPIEPPLGIVAWWPLDVDARDLAGRNNGNLFGAPAFGDGRVRGAMAFDGTDDSVRIPAASSLNVGVRSGLTIEGWIFPADLTQLRPLVEWNDGSIGAHFWTGVDIASAGDGIGALFANLIDSTGANHQIRSPKNLLSVGQWQHVALSYDKTTGIAALYHNGIVVTQANLGIFTPRTTGDLYLGNRPAGPFSGIHWKGKLDEVSLYNRALPASEISAVFAAGAAGKIAPTNPPLNNAPIAKLLVEPQYIVWPDQTNIMVIAVDGVQTSLTLDGSLSSDPDGDLLVLQWTRDDEGVPFASGSLVTNLFSVGIHNVTLIADDGMEFGFDTAAVEIVDLDGALDELYGVLIESEIPRKDKRPLLATLGRVWDSFMDGRLNAGAKQLRAFQQKARAQLNGKNAETGKRLVYVAQQIIDSLNDYLTDHEEPWIDDKDSGKGPKR